MTEATMTNSSVKFTNEGEGLLLTICVNNAKWQLKFSRTAVNADMVLSVAYKAASLLPKR